MHTDENFKVIAASGDVSWFNWNRITYCNTSLGERLAARWFTYLWVGEDGSAKNQGEDCELHVESIKYVGNRRDDWSCQI